MISQKIIMKMTIMMTMMKMKAQIKKMGLQ